MYMGTETIPAGNEDTEADTDFYDNDSVLYDTLVDVQEEKSKFAQTLSPLSGNMPPTSEVKHTHTHTHTHTNELIF